VHVYDRTTQRSVRLQVDTSPRLTNTYYVFQVVWYDDTTILLRLLNRVQTVEDIALCDAAASGSCRLVTTNRAPMGWLEQGALLPVPERNSILQVRGSTQAAATATEMPACPACFAC
jgi:hypothetical protein